MNRERTWAGDIALIIGLGLILLVICNCAKAQCPGGVCPFPKAAKVAEHSVSGLKSTAIRHPREATCKRPQLKRCGVVRRVVMRVRGR